MVATRAPVPVLTYVHRRHHFSGFGAAAVASVLLLSAVAEACPNCPTARLVRASVFDTNFWTYLMFITLPLLVLALVCILLYRIGLERSQPATTPNAIDDSTLRMNVRTGDARS